MKIKSWKFVCFVGILAMLQMLWGCPGPGPEPPSTTGLSSAYDPNGLWDLVTTNTQKGQTQSIVASVIRTGDTFLVTIEATASKAAETKTGTISGNSYTFTKEDHGDHNDTGSFTLTSDTTMEGSTVTTYNDGHKEDFTTFKGIKRASTVTTVATETWGGTTSSGGSADTTLRKLSDGSIVAHGTWGSSEVTCAFQNAKVTLSGSSLNTTASGTCINTKVRPGFQISPFTLTVSSTLTSPGLLTSEWQMTFPRTTAGWPNQMPETGMGTATATLKSGNGITAANTAQAITAFSFTSPAVTGTINEGGHTIAVTVPAGTNVTNLVPTITHTGASINPASGVAQNFTSPVTYTVTAADTTTRNYSVTVSIAEPAAVIPGGLILYSAAKPGGTNSDFELYTMKPDGTEIKQLTSNNYYDGRGRFSPDGNKIVYIRIILESSRHEVRMMDKDGSHDELIMSDAYVDYACFSPDGTKLAISKQDIVIYNLNTKIASKIVGSSIYTGTNSMPDWSSDGSKIVFVNKFLYRAYYSNIEIVNVDGSSHKALTQYNEFTPFTDGVHGPYAGEPRWSPGGSLILYTVNQVLYLMKADGSSQTSLGKSAASPIFSPDGSYAMVSQNNKLVLIKMDSSLKQTILTNESNGYSYPLDWKAN